MAVIVGKRGVFALCVVGWRVVVGELFSCLAFGGGGLLRRAVLFAWQRVWWFGVLFLARLVVASRAC